LKSAILNRDMKSLNSFTIFNNPCWIISSNKTNFNYSLRCNKIWGLTDKWFPQWRSLGKGNLLFFYISGVKRIIGIGKATGNNFIQLEPLWPDEIETNKLIYPLRFEFSVEFLLEENDWKNKGIKITDFIQKKFGRGGHGDFLRGGLNFIRHKELLDYLVLECKEKFGYGIKAIPSEIPIIEEKFEHFDQEKKHSSLINLIYEIGKMNGYLSLREFSFEKLRFDCVWKRVEKGSPFYVFEVQVGGDLYRALAKLKHAYDLWNSKIFLIIDSNDDKSQAFKLLEGSFHEIKDKIKILSSGSIVELFEKKRTWIEFEKQIGIL